MRALRRFSYLAVAWLLVPPSALAVLGSAVLARFFYKSVEKPRLVWGSDPIINNRYWSQAMRQAGYESETFTVSFYPSISNRAEWNEILMEKFGRLPLPGKLVLAFCLSLFRYDVFFFGYNGYFIGATPIRKLQALAFRIARKKTVLIPYGADYFVYRRIKGTTLTHALLLSYPDHARRQRQIADQLDYWTRYADVVIPGMMGPDGSGRWDVLAPSSLTIDTEKWRPTGRRSDANGINAPVVVVHAPNHRGFKGSEFVIDAVGRLQKEGLRVELRLLERLQNDVVRRVLCNEADILIEQLIATGHGFNAIEGMAAGLPVVSNLEDTQYTLPFRRWSFLNECPIASASPETVVDVLRQLVTRPDIRRQLADASRAYAEKYHSIEAAQFLFISVLDKVAGRPVDLLNLYHPLKGTFPADRGTIEHPLRDNKIVQ